MPHQTNPIIDSGIVEAPPASQEGNSPTIAAPSQATQDSTPFHHNNGVNHFPTKPSTNHHLNNHAYETGVASHHQGGQTPFQPQSSTQYQENSHNRHSNAPPLPSRENAAVRADGVGNENQPHGHGPPNVRRGDYASGAGHNAEMYPETNNTTTTSTGAGVGTGNGTVDNRSTGAKIKESAGGVKGLVAAVHGAGETLRGTFNSNVDRAFHDKAGEIKNERIARDGEAEIQEGRFANSTKNREGVVPGADGERRNQAF